MSTRTLIKGLAGLRIAYAAGLLAAPGRVASPWIGAAGRADARSIFLCASK